jgi:hypothetical protein
MKWTFKAKFDEMAIPELYVSLWCDPDKDDQHQLRVKYAMGDNSQEENDALMHAFGQLLTSKGVGYVTGWRERRGPISWEFTDLTLHNINFGDTCSWNDALEVEVVWDYGAHKRVAIDKSLKLDPDNT